MTSIIRTGYRKLERVFIAVSAQSIDRRRARRDLQGCHHFSPQHANETAIDSAQGVSSRVEWQARVAECERAEGAAGECNHDECEVSAV